MCSSIVPKTVLALVGVILIPQTEDAGRGGVLTSPLSNWDSIPPPWGVAKVPKGKPKVLKHEFQGCWVSIGT